MRGWESVVSLEAKEGVRSTLIILETRMSGLNLRLCYVCVRMNSFEKLSSSTGRRASPAPRMHCNPSKFEPGLPLGLLEWIERKQHADGPSVVVSATPTALRFFFGVGRVATCGPFPTALTRTDPTHNQGLIATPGTCQPTLLFPLTIRTSPIKS